jgi:hypothetical protein
MISRLYTVALAPFMILAEPQRVTDHPFSSRSATMVPGDAPERAGAKSRPRRCGG